MKRGEFVESAAISGAVWDEWVSVSAGRSAARSLIERRELSRAHRRENEMTEAGSGAERSQSCARRASSARGGSHATQRTADPTHTRWELRGVAARRARVQILKQRY